MPGKQPTRRRPTRAPAPRAKGAGPAKRRGGAALAAAAAIRRPRAAPAPAARPAVRPFGIVGISVGEAGHDACADLVAELPCDLPMAVVVAPQRGDRPADDHLPSVLAARAAMPVFGAADGVELRPGHVYVIPRRVVLGVANGRFQAAPRPGAGKPLLPADFFLRSLANYAGAGAIGVVLCGSEADGTIGLQEIKGAGGIAIAQDPRTAVNDGAPRSAITSGAVDLVLAPRTLARELSRLASQAPPDVAAPCDPGDAPDDARGAGPGPAVEHLSRLFAIVRSATGVDFTHYKYPTIQRRLQRRMLLHKIDNLGDYVRHLKQHPAEVQALYHDLLIKVTRFFRDPESFDALARKVFPAVVDDRPEGDPIRIWVPGCSSGEEPYSVAMSLLEYLADHHAGAAVQIFATDVSERAVEQARTGSYPESIAADVSPERLRRFFTHANGKYQIAKPVRDLCVFARQDLTRDPPFSRLDLILCRNVLIYLGPVLQKRLMHVFHYALKGTGFLMLGGAETTGLYSNLFSVADKRNRLYRKKSTSMPQGIILGGDPAGDGRGSRLTVADGNGNGNGQAAARRRGRRAPSGGAGGANHGTPAASGTAPSAGSIQGEANRIVLTRYAPPGVVIGEDYQIIQFRGQTGMFLQPAPGDASLNVLKMAREGLLYGLRTALQEARLRKAPVRKEGLRVRHDGNFHEVSIEVVPLTPSGRTAHYLVLFEDRTRPGAAPKAPKGASRGKAAGKARGKGGKAGTRQRESVRLAQVEEELAASRDYLQSIIQDLEAANEELQSANEEILSSNEELQSTNEELDTAKEELQSTNEELNTLNEELHGRNEELSRANGDLLNLLSNVQLAIVMVDGQLRVRRFTPMAERLLNLIPTDVGRKISDIKPNVDAPDLEKLIIESIDTVSAVEREVRDPEGRRYALRVRPYKNLEHRIDGAVLALIDIEDARRHHLDAQAADRRAIDAAVRRDYAEAVIETVREPLMVLRADQTIRVVNRAFRETFELRGEEAEGKSLGDLLDGYFNTPPFRTLLRHVLANDTVEDFRVEQSFPRIGRRVLLINARRVAAEGPEPDLPPLILMAMEDVTSKAGNGHGAAGADEPAGPGRPDPAPGE